VCVCVCVCVREREREREVWYFEFCKMGNHETQASDLIRREDV
jgi:hypothetical protein